MDRGDDDAALAVAVACALGPEAAYECANDCIQVLGGIGFTWEHDAHLHLKRAMAVRLLAGTSSRWRADVAASVCAGVRRVRSLELPPEAKEDAWYSSGRGLVSVSGVSWSRWWGPAWWSPAWRRPTCCHR